MNEKRYIGKLFISIGLILIFISSSTRYIPEFKYLTDYLFLIGGLFIVIYGVVSLIHKDIEINRSFKIVTLIYAIFISSSIRYIPEFKYLTDYLFLIGGLFIVIYGVVSLIHKDIEINRSFKNVTLIYGIFISFVMISTFVNHNLETEIDALVKFTL